MREMSHWWTVTVLDAESRRSMVLDVFAIDRHQARRYAREIMDREYPEWDALLVRTERWD